MYLGIIIYIQESIVKPYNVAFKSLSNRLIVGVASLRLKNIKQFNSLINLNKQINKETSRVCK